MKRYNKNFRYTHEFITACIYKCLNGKWYRRDVYRCFVDVAIENNLNDYYTEESIKYFTQYDRSKMHDLIIKIAENMYQEITTRSIKLRPIRYNMRFDNCSKKWRKIGVSSIKQQMYDYIAVESMLNMFHSKIGRYQCASIKGRGQSYGARAIERWIRRTPHKTRYAYKCDIKKYYPSVDHEKLKELLKRDIKNDDCLYLLFALIDSYQNGLCIGSYLSQYLANYYLSYAYHFLTEKMIKTRKQKNGSQINKNMVSYCLFYMDDIIIFSSRKADLKIVIKRFEKYLNEFLHLKIKKGSIMFKVDDRCIDMMGYKIYRDHTEIRKRIYKKIRKVFLKYKEDSIMTVDDARKIVSYYGYIKHSNSKNLKKKYNIEKTLKLAKERLKNESNLY